MTHWVSLWEIAHTLPSHLLGLVFQDQSKTFYLKQKKTASILSKTEQRNNLNQESEGKKGRRLYSAVLCYAVSKMIQFSPVMWHFLCRLRFVLTFKCFFKWKLNDSFAVQLKKTCSAPSKCKYFSHVRGCWLILKPRLSAAETMFTWNCQYYISFP